MDFITDRTWLQLMAVAGALVVLLGLRERYRLRLHGTPHFVSTAVLGAFLHLGWGVSCIAMLVLVGWLAALVGFVTTAVLGTAVSKALKPKDLLSRAQESEAENAILLERLFVSSTVRETLLKRGVGLDDFKNLHGRIRAVGASRAEAEAALRNVSLLNWYFSLPDPLTPEVGIQLSRWVLLGVQAPDE